MAKLNSRRVHPAVSQLNNKLKRREISAYESGETFNPRPQLVTTNRLSAERSVAPVDVKQVAVEGKRAGLKSYLATKQRNAANF